MTTTELTHPTTTPLNDSCMRAEHDQIHGRGILRVDEFESIMINVQFCCAEASVMDMEPEEIPARRNELTLVKLVDVNYDDDAVLPLSLVFADADWEYLEGVSRGQYADPTRQGDISRLSHLLDRLLTEVPRLIDPN